MAAIAQINPKDQPEPHAQAGNALPLAKLYDDFRRAQTFGRAGTIPTGNRERESFRAQFPS